MKPLLPLALAGVVLAAGHDDPKPDRLEYRTPAGVTYIVTADGLSEVRLGDRVIAKGGWRFKSTGDAVWGFPSAPDAEAITNKSLEIVSPTEARVTHTHAHATVRHTLTFSGEDVRTESYVENRHPTATIQVPEFDGPRVSFGRKPVGILPNWHWTYTAHGGVTFMHPGGIRIGGSYGLGDGFGVSAAPLDAGLHSVALFWDWDWSPGKREADPNRTPRLFVHAPIPPRGARTISISFRFSPNTDWSHLLDPYRRHLHATLGAKPLYDRPSHLPLIAGVVSGPESVRGPTNPYAYEPHRRLDSVNGVITYHAALAPHMRAIPAQGLVIWGQGGNNPRGQMFRPDFDILPPDIVPNLRRLAGLFREQGMRFGVCARPGQMVTPFDWSTDTVVSISPARADELNLLIRRFQNMTALGSSLFYLDSFGNRIEDVAIMRAVRTGHPTTVLPSVKAEGKAGGIGPGVQTYVEHPCDLIAPYSGLLPVLDGSAADGKLGIAFEGAFWLNPPQTPTMPEVIRYFYPDVPIVALVSGATGPDTDERRQAAAEYCFKLRMTPMIPDYWLDAEGKTAEWMARMTRKYLTADGQWKAKADQ
jgi:hypothetical protein